MKFSFTLLLLFFVLIIRDLPAGGLDYNTTFGTRTFSLNGLYYAGNAGLGSVFSNPAGLGLLRGIALEGSNPNTSLERKHQLVSELYFEARKTTEIINKKLTNIIILQLHSHPIQLEI